MTTCIFVSKPPECEYCLDSLKLQCLLNHRKHVVAEKGKVQLLRLIIAEVADPERMRTEPRKD